MGQDLTTVFKKRKFRMAAAGLFTAFLVYLVWRNVSVAVFRSVFESLDVGTAMLALLAFVGVTAIRALRFTTLGAKTTFASAFHIAAVHAALLRVMPLRSGELAYAVLLKRQGGGGVTEGLASIIMLRILDLATVLPLGAVGVASFFGAASATLVVILMVVFGGLFGVLFFTLESMLVVLEARLASAGEGTMRARFAKLCRAAIAVYDLPLSKRISLVALTVAMWGLLLVFLHYSLYALGAVSNLSQSFTTSVFAISGSVIPLSLVGSFGPMEGGIALGLTGAGHAKDVALASALLVSALTFVCNWAVAIPSWIALLLADRPGTGPSNVVQRRLLGALCFSVVGALLLLFKYPYVFEGNDQFQYLLLPYREIYANFLTGDWFTWEVSHYHVTFSWIIRALYAIFGPSGFPVAVFALHFLVLVSLCYGVLALAQASGFHWTAAAGAILAVVFIDPLGLGGAIVNHNMLLPADMALPLFLIAAARWITGHRIRAGIFLGLAGFVHANFAILGPLVFAVPETVRWVHTRRFRDTLWFALAYLALAWPSLAMSVAAFLASDAAPSALDILFRVRSPHHYTPDIFKAKELWWILAMAVGSLPLWIRHRREDLSSRSIAILLVLVVTQLVAIAGTALDIRPLVRLFLWRLSIPLILVLAMGTAEGLFRAIATRQVHRGVFAVAALAIMVSFSADGLVRFTPELVLRGFGVLVPALLVLMLAAFLERYVVPPIGRRVSSGLSAAVLLWVVLASIPGAIPTGVRWSSAEKSWRTFYTINHRGIYGKRLSTPLYKWIRRHTPKDASFLIPPGTDDFRLGARRAVFVDWKCCPMKGEELLEWRRRMLAAMGTRKFPAKGYNLHRVANRRYGARPLKDLADLARLEGVTHVVVKGKSRTKAPAGLEKLVSKSGYTVFRVQN